MATNGSVQPGQASVAQASSSSGTPGPSNLSGNTSTSNGNGSASANSNAANAAKPQVNLISAITQAFRNQTGEPLQNDRIANLLLQHMPQLGELAKQGKLNYSQIMQLKEFADKNKAGPFPNPPAQSQAGSSSEPSTQQSQQSTQPTTSTTSSTNANSNLNTTSNANAYKSSSPAPALSSQPGVSSFPISQTLNSVNPGPVQWMTAMTAQQGRPTLSGGIPGGRLSGTPSQLARNTNTDDLITMGLSGLGGGSGDGNMTLAQRRKNTMNGAAGTGVNDQSMRRSIQDLVFSVDPNVKIEPEVEDLLLDIADEFIDSVTNFGCRLAKHRGGDTLEVRDLQLHLERNHNIRIPGFASDETRISISQSAIAPTTAFPSSTSTSSMHGTAGGGNKKGGGSGGGGGGANTLRNQRLTQVAQAKRDAKLM